MFRNPFYLFLVLLLNSGCDIFSPEEDSQALGALSLKYALSSESSANFINLGDIRNTRSYDFYLTNSGGSDLFDIVITSSNNQFLLEPDTIRALRSEDGAVPYQNLRVTIIHGTSASGVGPAEILAMGPNEVNLDITAKTTSNDGDTLLVSLQTILRVNALLVDIDLYDSRSLIDLKDGKSGIAGPLWERRSYAVEEGPLRIVNTGNVQLQIQILKSIPNTVPPAFREINVALAPLEERIIEREVERQGERVLFRIDGDNTTSDFESLPIQQDGLIYFACSS